MLLKNRMDPDKMPYNTNTKSKGKKWRVIRSYKSKFSCIEAVERLMKIHIRPKEKQL